MTRTIIDFNDFESPVFADTFTAWEFYMVVAHLLMIADADEVILDPENSVKLIPHRFEFEGCEDGKLRIRRLDRNE